MFVVSVVAHMMFDCFVYTNIQQKNVTTKFKSNLF